MVKSAGGGVALSEALLKLIGDNPRDTDGSLANLLVAQGIRSKRKAERLVLDTKRDLLDACAVEVRVPSGAGEEIPFCFVKPARRLQVICEHCPLFASMLWDLITAPSNRPGGRVQVLGTRQRPLQVILYEDGITPGNALDAANRRKYSGWFWTLRNFSKWLLCQDWAWFMCAAPLKRQLDALQGGKSTFCRFALREFWVNDSLAAGVSIDFGMCALTVFFSYDSFLADADSHRGVLGLAGRGW